MKLVELKDCPDGLFTAAWDCKNNVKGCSVRVVNHTITKVYQEFDRSDEEYWGQWIDADECSFQPDSATVRIVTNEPSI